MGSSSLLTFPSLKSIPPNHSEFINLWAKWENEVSSDSREFILSLAFLHYVYLVKQVLSKYVSDNICGV